MPEHQLNLLDQPPSVGGSRTSYEAAESVRSHVYTLRLKVFDYILKNGPCTDEEIAEALGMSQNTSRPRRVELCHRNLISEHETKGRTKSGRSACKWVVNEKV